MISRYFTSSILQRHHHQAYEYFTLSLIHNVWWCVVVDAWNILISVTCWHAYDEWMIYNSATLIAAIHCLTSLHMRVIVWCLLLLEWIHIQFWLSIIRSTLSLWLWAWWPFIHNFILWNLCFVLAWLLLQLENLLNMKFIDSVQLPHYWDLFEWFFLLFFHHQKTSVVTREGAKIAQFKSKLKFQAAKHKGWRKWDRERDEIFCQLRKGFYYFFFLIFFFPLLYDWRIL